MVLSRLSAVFFFLCGFVGSSVFYYNFLLFCVLVLFFFLRVPYIFGVLGFVLFLFGWIFPLYLSFFFSRLSCFGFSVFFCSFVPIGTPLWIAPFVLLAETVSYIVRPVVLLIRPFLNITIGSVGGSVLGSLFFWGSPVLVFLLVLFFYEIFVALVHWFIICNILSFSENH